MITKEDVKKAQVGIGARTSAKTKQRVVQIHNEYANKILSACGQDAPPQLRKIALNYINELQKASRGSDIQNYKNACDNKLEAFRAQVRDAGLGEFLVQMETNAQDRHVASEAAADLRSDDLAQTVVQSGQAVIEAVNEHTDQVGAALEQTVKNEGAATRKQVRATGNSVIRRIGVSERNIKSHMTLETDRGIAANAQNTSAMLGVDAEGYTVGGDGGRELYNGGVVADSETVVGKDLQNMRALHGVDKYNNQVDDKETLKTTDGVLVYGEDTTLGRMDRTRDAVNNHTTKEVNRGVEELKLDAQQQSVLLSKRQALSDMLMNEVNEAFPGAGYYRDSTVKWLGSAADRVMAGTDMSFKEKEQALDELIRMVDEENIISDGDRAEFEAKYFYKTKERPHI